MNIIQLKKIAQKYASALAELSLDEFVISELSFIENLVNQEKIVTFLRDPNIELKQKEEKLLAAISDYVSKPVQSLVLLLLKKNRANVLPLNNLSNIYKFALNCCCSCHDWAHKVRSTTSSLSSFKVSV